MKRLSLSISLCVPGLLASLALSGCSGFNNLETSGPVTQQVTMSGLSGSNFGGHAPVVGADIYLLQTGITGYNSAPTSLLTSSYDTRYAFPTTNTSADGDNAPTGAYSVKTDSSGAFYISNYACTVGYPVYMAAVGGTTTSASAFTINGYNSANGTVVYTIPAGQNAVLYVGQTVTITESGVATPFSVTVTASTVPSGTAAGSLSTTTTANTTTGTHTITASGTPNGAENNATLNLATLGLCPSSGNFYTAGSGQLSYVYMNEVSTVATALAFGGFGTGPFNIGIPNNGTVGTPDPNALIGIQNAALNANQLYDVTGGNITTANQGEGHIARLYTPGGNGIVPQALINTLGNILASCVDSVNTTVGTTNAALSAESASCSTLFEQATSDGARSTGGSTVPTDIATAAFNIAHHPAGPSGGSGTTTTAGSSLYFMTQLFPLQVPTSPFEPSLTARPNDFTAAIRYTTSVNGNANPVAEAESIGIDIDGSIWINSASSRQIIKFSPQGVVQYTSPVSAYSYGYLSIDIGGNVWTGNNFTNAGETKFSGTGTSYAPTVYTGPTATPFNGTATYDAYITVTDGAGNAYAAATPQTNATANDNQWYTINYSSTGAATATSILTDLPEDYVVAHGAIDSAGFLWWTTELSVRTGNTNTASTAIGRFNLAGGATSTGFPIYTNTTNYARVRGAFPGKANTNISAPEMPSIDSGGNLWVANQNGGSGGSVMRVTPAGAVAMLASTTTTADISGPFGASVDGAGHVWIANRSTGSSTDSSLLEVSYVGTTITPISPTTNYTLGFGIANNNSTMPAPLNLAVDQSGVVWITSYDGNQLMELLGPGTPTYNPISAGIGAKKLGAQP